MKKDVKFLSKGLFSAPFMQSRIKTHSMTFKEKLLGFFVGPAGIIVFNSVINNLRELFYTSVVPVDNLFGMGTYLIITTLTSIIGILFGLAISYVIERTVSPAGRIRPYILIASVILLISGAMLFACPFEQGSTLHLIWLYAGNILFSGVGMTIFNFRYQKIALETRNLKDRSSTTTVYYAADNIISGVIVGMAVSSILYYRMLAHDMTGDNWRKLVFGTLFFAIPLMLVEYFYTRERVTEETNDISLQKDGTIERIPLKKQLKALLTNKYYLLTSVMTLGLALTGSLQGSNIRTNYCQWVLGANAENNLHTMYMVIAMAPMGFGIALIFPAVKKLGARMTVIIGSIICVVTGILCMVFPTSVPVAFAGSFVFSFGTLAITYVGPVFAQQANDIIEYKHGFRPEGSVASNIIGVVYGALLTPAAGLYETVLVALGYDAYSNAGQNASVVTWIVFVWFGIVVIKGLVYLICLIPFDAEEVIASVQVELKARHKQAVLARGEEWIDPEEMERLAKEESEHQFEENRIADLKVYCAKKGLDFDAENQKYLNKKVKKDAKKTKKRARA